MMNLIKILLFLFCIGGFAQSVSVNDTSNTPAQLVDLLLDGACVEVSNVSVSSPQSVAYFNDNGGAFPITEGVVIRSGKAKFSEGNYTGEHLGSQMNTNGNAALEEINNNSGQSSAITDVAFLEFEFVPLSSDFNFNFLFASNEYGEWQCASSDIFAFLLTNLSTGETSNLAVIPGTTTPVSVRNIKNNAYNPACESSNANLFGSYLVNNPSASAINMRGYTTVMTASAEIIPGNTYKIELIIGDSNDSNYDSAIFLSAGSFDASLDLGADKSLCDGDSIVLETGLSSSVYTHSWTLNGTVIPNETGSTLLVEEPGVYAVQLNQITSNCVIEDEVIISDLQVGAPQDLVACYNENEMYSYDLTQDNEAALGVNPEQFEVLYYASNANLIAGNNIPASELQNFQSAGDQTIFLKLKNTVSGNICGGVYDFQLLATPQMQVLEPTALNICLVPNEEPVVDLTQKISEIIGAQNTANFNFSFFTSEEDAVNNSNAIPNPAQVGFPVETATQMIWLRVVNNLSGCSAMVNFAVNLNEPPLVDEIENVVACSSFVLPEIQNGNYYSGTQGTGVALFAGDVIQESGTYYIFSGPDENGCTNQTNFYVTLVDEFDLNEVYCGEFIVPFTPLGQFFTAEGGAEGTGEQILPNTVITQSQTLYFYAEVDGVLCRDEAFEITILPLPPVDEPANVVTCNSYELPPLQNGNYYTATNGGGNQLNAGDLITTSKNIYVFNDDGTCTNEHVFNIKIISDFENINACGSYTLPNLHVGGYFTAAGGQGESIAEGTVITSSQTVFYFSETTTTPNCTENMSFHVQINPIPPVDELADVLLCETEAFELPPLQNGEYFTQPNRNGTQLFPGDFIEETSTVYINNLANGCTNETSFHVEIRPLPLVENFTDVYSCSSYELPVLTHGTYYSQPNGEGQTYNGGDIINSTRTLYIYNTWEDLSYCSNQDSFTIYIEDIQVEELEDVNACDFYMLPTLSQGGYFTQSGGEGTQLFPGDLVTESMEIFVYEQRGTRFLCVGETSFHVNISETPILNLYEDMQACGSYTLPEFLEEGVDIGYYWEAGGEVEIATSEYTITTPGNYTIYVFASAEGNAACIAEEQFELTIYPLQEIFIEGGIICRNPETGEVETPAYLTSGLNPAEFEVQWYLDNTLVHTGTNFEATQAGEYSVEFIKLTEDVGANCNYKPTTVVVGESGIPVIRVNVSEAFADVAVINVEMAAGYGEYEFSLNDGEYQSSPEFYDVPSGSHIVKARGKDGNCGVAVLPVEILKHPKFFTPNNDGYNDTWNIWSLSDHPEAKIQLYDRYGKLLGIISATGNGWDGTFHGKNLPSNDYWFKASYVRDGVAKEFKSHFSLKR